MYRKISTIVIPTLIAAGILGYMLYSIWDDLLIAIQHIIPLYLVVAVTICLMRLVAPRLEVSLHFTAA